jgi:hypothetical protein
MFSATLAPVEAIATDLLGRTLPDWIISPFESIQMPTFILHEEDWIFDLIVSPNASSIGVLVTVWNDLFMESFRFNILINGRPIPLLNGAPIQNITTFFNETFTYQIPVDVFGNSTSNLSVYAPELPWINFIKSNRTLQGVALDTGKVQIIGTNKEGAFNGYTLKIDVQKNPNDQTSDALNSEKSIAPEMTVMVAIVVLLCLIFVGALIFSCLRKNNPRIRSSRRPKLRWKRWFVSHRKFNVPFVSYPIERPDVPEKELECKPSVVDDSEGTLKSEEERHELEVKATIGRAIHFVYPIENMLEQLGLTPDVSEQSPTISTPRNILPTQPQLFTKDSPTGSRLIHDAMNEIDRLDEVGSQLAGDATTPSDRHLLQDLVVNKRYTQGTTSIPSSFNAMDTMTSTSSLGSHVPYAELRFTAKLTPNGNALPAWLHFNPKKCSFFGIPYVFDAGVWHIEVMAYRLDFLDASDGGGPQVVASACETFHLHVEAEEC